MDKKAAMASHTQSVTAATRALVIVELLEGTLVHLQPKDILTSQRVSTTWQTTIKESTKLQKALYYMPSSDHMHVIQQHGFESQETLCFPHAFDREASPDGDDLLVSRSLRYETKHEACVLNPLFELLFHEKCSSGSTNVTEAFMEKLAKYENPSWERMYLTTPCLTKLWLHITCSREPEESEVLYSEALFMESEIYNAEGIMIGDFVRELRGYFKDGRMGHRNFKSGWLYGRKEFEIGRDDLC